MTDLKFVSLNNKLAAVPVGGGRLESKPIGDERYDEDDPSTDVVDKIILSGNHRKILQ